MPKKKEDEVLGGYQRPLASDDEAVAEKLDLSVSCAAVAGDGELGAVDDGALDSGIGESAAAVGGADMEGAAGTADDSVLVGDLTDSDDPGAAGALADIGEADTGFAEEAAVEAEDTERAALRSIDAALDALDIALAKLPPRNVAHAEPKIGYSAHYVLDSGNNAGDCRAMVIVRVWPDNGLLQGVVFFDGTNDGRGVAEWVTSVHRDDTAQEHKTWHWPWSCPRDF